MPPKKSNRQPRTNKHQEKRQFRKQRQKQQYEYGDANWTSDFQKFQIQLETLGLKIKDVAGDGNCLFRSLADQIEGSPDNHSLYRQKIVQFIEDNREDYEPFIEDDVPFLTYCNKMRTNATWGGNMEIQAASLVFSVNICIHQLDHPRWELLNFDSTHIKIHLSYHSGDHYNSVRRSDDPGTGFPLPIIVQPKKLNPVSEPKDKPTEIEHQVMDLSGCSNLNFVRRILQDNFGDLNAAVDMIMEWGPNETESQNRYIENSDENVNPTTFSNKKKNKSKDNKPQQTERENLQQNNENEFKVIDSKNQNFKGSKNVPQFGRKKNSTAVSFSASDKKDVAVLNPKLSRFEKNRHMTNKERQRQARLAKRIETEAERKKTEPDPVIPPDVDLQLDLGSLEI